MLTRGRKRAAAGDCPGKWSKIGGDCMFLGSLCADKGEGWSRLRGANVHGVLALNEELGSAAADAIPEGRGIEVLTVPVDDSEDEWAFLR